MKWETVPPSPREDRAWRAYVVRSSGRGTYRYTIREVSDYEDDLYVLNVDPSAYGFEAFVDRDGYETDARTSRAEFRSKDEAVRAAGRHAQRHKRGRS